ncbi:hypothetical protein BGP_2081 [Beggiatoa sp. PS]|nr:hypothetical protein BGP_2081 [Beggiatoa sp. PS]
MAFLLHNIWHGKTDEVLDYLKTKIEAKNDKKLEELIAYIEKHQEEIVDYERRKKARKEIGLEPELEEDGDDDVVQNQQSFNTETVSTERVSIPCHSVIGKHQSLKNRN